MHQSGWKKLLSTQGLHSFGRTKVVARCTGVWMTPHDTDQAIHWPTSWYVRNRMGWWTTTVVSFSLPTNIMIEINKHQNKKTPYHLLQFMFRARSIHFTLVILRRCGITMSVKGTYRSCTDSILCATSAAGVYQNQRYYILLTVYLHSSHTLVVNCVHNM